MPRKRRKRRQAGRSAIAPWVILAGSLTVIGFACSRPSHSPQTSAPSSSPVARAPQAGAPQTPGAVKPPAATPPTAGAPQPAVAPQRGPSAAVTSGAPGVSAAPTVEPSARASPIVASPAPETSAAPRLALIIDDCGQWPTTERGFIALPVRLTLSVLPDVRFNHIIEREAVDGNKGVMLHLPMETLSGINPGPGKVTTEMGDAAINAEVEHDLGNVDLATGVNNHEGSKATANVRVMNDVMAVLARHNRFFIDSRTNGASVAETVASQNGVATAGRDVFLDNRADVGYTEMQLRAAVAIARRTGSAIAIGHPRPTTLIAVRTMIPELEADGIKFVLASDLTR